MRTLKFFPFLFLLLSTTAHAETVELNVQSAAASTDPYQGLDVINVTLAPESQQALADFTRDRVGQQIHLRVEGRLLTSPTLRSVLDTRSLQVSAGVDGFDGKSAQEIASTLIDGGTLTLSDER